jgi:hypothetical protein
VTAPPVNFYCYYRVDLARSGLARGTVAHIFRAVEERLGVVGRLFKGEREPALWMEVYEHVREPDRFEIELAELCESQGFASLLAAGSTRRIERFVPL